VIAGGKRRADLTAERTTRRAESSNWSAPCSKRGWKRCGADRTASFNTLGSIDQLIRPIAARVADVTDPLSALAMPQMRDGSRPTLGQQVDLQHLDVWRSDGGAPRVGVNVDVLRSPAGDDAADTVENAIKHGPENGSGQPLEISAR
jgi:hypothetical protein